MVKSWLKGVINLNFNIDVEAIGKEISSKLDASYEKAAKQFYDQCIENNKITSTEFINFTSQSVRAYSHVFSVALIKRVLEEIEKS